jgi:hypothetical protein
LGFSVLLGDRAIGFLQQFLRIYGFSEFLRAASLTSRKEEALPSYMADLTDRVFRIK